MERSEYDKLDRSEDRMWWFAGAAQESADAVAAGPARSRAAAAILDAGCGTGGFLARLAASVPERAVFGLELDPQACMRAARKERSPGLRRIGQ